MLEAQIIVHPTGTPLREGDVLLVALEGHPWGTYDTRHLLVVKWPDEVAERQLRELQKEIEWPVLVYPYESPSKKSIDLRKHPRREAILDRDTHVAILGVDEYKTRSGVWTRVLSWLRSLI